MHSLHPRLRYPDLWRGCIFAPAPCLGPSGLRLHDNSGYGNHGTLTGLTPAQGWQINDGKYAMTFAGASQYVACGRVAEMENAKQFSASMWLRRTAASNTVSISKRTSGTNIFFLGFSAGVLFLAPINTNTNYGTYDLNDTKWHHAVMLFDGTQSSNETRLRLVLDGRETPLTYTGTVGAAMTSSTNNLLLSLTNVTYSTGSMDDIRLYNHVLSVTEAETLASRRGIAYEMKPRSRSSIVVGAAFRPAWASQRSQLIGGGIR